MDLVISTMATYHLVLERLEGIPNQTRIPFLDAEDPVCMGFEVRDDPACAEIEDGDVA